MKKNSLIIFLICCLGCTNEVQIISSLKQRIIPGIKTTKPYTKYIFKIQVETDRKITIDSILVFQEKQCFYPRFSQRKENESKYVEHINSKGFYFIEAAIKEGNYLKKSHRYRYEKCR